MSNLNYNPKVLHTVLEIIQWGTGAATVLSFAGKLPIPGVPAGLLGGIGAAITAGIEVLQSNVVGNIPAKTP